MKKTLVLLVMIPALLGGCSNVKKTLGMERNQPDEFAVVERAPLTMPPNFNLLPPRPGTEAAKAADSAVTAENLVLGTGNPSAPVASTAENAVLSGAGAVTQKPVDGTGSATLDPSAETTRLKQQNVKTSPVISPAHAQ